MVAALKGIAAGRVFTQNLRYDAMASYAMIAEQILKTPHDAVPYYGILVGNNPRWTFPPSEAPSFAAT